MGAKALVASKQISTSTAEAGVFVGKGLMMIKLSVTALTLGSGYDVVNFLIQRNTAAATSTWEEIGQVCVGDVAGLGVAQGADVYTFVVNNTGDYQIRVNAYLAGSAVNVTYSAQAYPLRSKEAA
jgi:hypothetical protein